MHPIVKACPARRGWGLDCLSSAVNSTRQVEKSPPLAVPQCFERHSALLRDTVHGAAAAYPTAIIQILHNEQCFSDHLLTAHNDEDCAKSLASVEGT